jgi:AcrR family transcriptional regulator
MSKRESDHDLNRASAQIFRASGSAAPRRQPRQERARFTFAMILKAAIAVIDEVGWAHASTNRIAERAGVSIGSLYQYFPNREAILASLMEEHREAVHAVVGRAMAGLGDPAQPVSRSLRRLFEDLVQLHREDPVLTRVLSTEVPHLLARKDHSESEELAVALQQALKQRHDTCVVDVASASHVLATTAEALTRWLVHEAPESLDTDSLIREIVTMLSGYLTGGAGR